MIRNLLFKVSGIWMEAGGQGGISLPAFKAWTL